MGQARRKALKTRELVSGHLWRTCPCRVGSDGRGHATRAIALLHRLPEGGRRVRCGIPCLRWRLYAPRARVIFSTCPGLRAREWRDDAIAFARTRKRAMTHCVDLAAQGIRVHAYRSGDLGRAQWPCGRERDGGLPIRPFADRRAMVCRSYERAGDLRVFQNGGCSRCPHVHGSCERIGVSGGG